MRLTATAVAAESKCQCKWLTEYQYNSAMKNIGLLTVDSGML